MNAEPHQCPACGADNWTPWRKGEQRTCGACGVLLRCVQYADRPPAFALRRVAELLRTTSPAFTLEHAPPARQPFDLEAWEERETPVKVPRAARVGATRSKVKRTQLRRARAAAGGGE